MLRDNGRAGTRVPHTMEDYQGGGLGMEVALRRGTKSMAYSVPDGSVAVVVGMRLEYDGNTTTHTFFQRGTETGFHVERVDPRVRHFIEIEWRDGGVMSDGEYEADDFCLYQYTIEEPPG